MISVDSVGAVTFGGAGGSKYIPGLGTSRRPELYSAEGLDYKLLIQ